MDEKGGKGKEGKGREGSGGPPIHSSGYATEKWPVQSENRDDVPALTCIGWTDERPRRVLRYVTITAK